MHNPSFLSARTCYDMLDFISHHVWSLSVLAILDNLLRISKLLCGQIENCGEFVV